MEESHNNSYEHDFTLDGQIAITTEEASAYSLQDLERGDDSGLDPEEKHAIQTIYEDLESIRAVQLYQRLQMIKITIPQPSQEASLRSAPILKDVVRKTVVTAVSEPKFNALLDNTKRKLLRFITSSSEALEALVTICDSAWVEAVHNMMNKLDATSDLDTRFNEVQHLADTSVWTPLKRDPRLVIYGWIFSGLDDVLSATEFDDEPNNYTGATSNDITRFRIYQSLFKRTRNSPQESGTKLDTMMERAAVSFNDRKGFVVADLTFLRADAIICALVLAVMETAWIVVSGSADTKKGHRISSTRLPEFVEAVRQDMPLPGRLCPAGLNRLLPLSEDMNLTIWTPAQDQLLRDKVEEAKSAGRNLKIEAIDEDISSAILAKFGIFRSAYVVRHRRLNIGVHYRGVPVSERVETRMHDLARRVVESSPKASSTSQIEMLSVLAQQAFIHERPSSELLSRYIATARAAVHHALDASSKAVFSMWTIRQLEIVCRHLAGIAPSSFHFAKAKRGIVDKLQQAGLQADNRLIENLCRPALPRHTKLGLTPTDRHKMMYDHCQSKLAMARGNAEGLYVTSTKASYAKMPVPGHMARDIFDRLTIKHYLSSIDAMRSAAQPNAKMSGAQAAVLNEIDRHFQSMFPNGYQDGKHYSLDDLTMRARNQRTTDVNGSRVRARVYERHRFSYEVSKHLLGKLEKEIEGGTFDESTDSIPEWVNNQWWAFQIENSDKEQSDKAESDEEEFNEEKFNEKVKSEVFDDRELSTRPRRSAAENATQQITSLYETTATSKRTARGNARFQANATSRSDSPHSGSEYATPDVTDEENSDLDAPPQLPPTKYKRLGKTKAQAINLDDCESSRDKNKASGDHVLTRPHGSRKIPASSKITRFAATEAEEDETIVVRPLPSFPDIPSATFAAVKADRALPASSTIPRITPAEAKDEMVFARPSPRFPKPPSATSSAIKANRALPSMLDLAYGAAPSATSLPTNHIGFMFNDPTLNFDMSASATVPFLPSDMPDATTGGPKTDVHIKTNTILYIQAKGVDEGAVSLPLEQIGSVQELAGFVKEVCADFVEGKLACMTFTLPWKKTNNKIMVFETRSITFDSVLNEIRRAPHWRSASQHELLEVSVTATFK